MTHKVNLTHKELTCAARQLVLDIRNAGLGTFLRVYAIPRGGIPAFYLVQIAAIELKIMGAPKGLTLDLVTNPAQADIFIDDLIDSGRTKQKYQDIKDVPFFALFNKQLEFVDNPWLCFPWEQTAERGMEDHIVRLLQYVGEDSKREGLVDTPKRVLKAWDHWTSGYGQNPKDVLKVFTDGAEDYDEMVIVKDIPLYSKCEHHLADIFGTVTIAYIPDGKIVGLSKLSRLVDMFARRLQVQERLTSQIANALNDNLSPKGVGVVIKARHMCMESRGICQQGHHTITSALRGVLKENGDARAEFMALAK